MSYKDVIKTIQDLEDLYYSPEGSEYIAKTNAPISSSTTGVYNAIYGAQVWGQINQEANALGLLPKYPFLRSGWRVYTDVVNSTGTTVRTASGGIAELTTNTITVLPDTLRPSFVEVSAKPKTVAHTFDVSETQAYLSTVDDAIGDMESLRPIMGIYHAETLNKMLLGDVTNLPSNNFESIDRVISSFSEVSSCADITAGDSDIYSLDRDAAASWSDAYVNHNSNVNRALTDAIIRTTIVNIAQNGGHTSIALTGHISTNAVMGLYSDQARYNNPMSQMKVQLGVNGVKTADGAEVGMNVATIYGLPFFQSKDVVQDGSSSGDRVYFMDTSNPEGFDRPRLGIAIAKPTQYFEGGLDAANKDPFGVNRFGTVGMYRTMGELICTVFKAQGKIRDLS